MSESSILWSCGLIAAAVLVPLCLYYLVHRPRTERPEEIFESGINTVGSASKPYSMGGLSRFYVYLCLIIFLGIGMYFILQWVRLHDQESLVGALISICFLALFYCYSAAGEKK